MRNENLLERPPPWENDFSAMKKASPGGSATRITGIPCEGELKWPPLSRPFLDRNKLRIGGSDLRSGAAEAALAIPALESALRSHSCVALSSAQVPLLWSNQKQPILAGMR